VRDSGGGLAALATGSIPPEVLEPDPRQRRVDRRAGDRPMAEPALVGQRVAAGVAQHVGMGLDLKFGASRRALDQRAKPAVVNGDPRSLTKTKRRALSLEPAQRPQFVALDRMGARRAVLSNQSAIPGSGGSTPSAVAKALR
jgi:hypothetical protein